MYDNSWQSNNYITFIVISYCLVLFKDNILKIKLIIQIKVNDYCNRIPLILTNNHDTVNVLLLFKLLHC